MQPLAFAENRVCKRRVKSTAGADEVEPRAPSILREAR